MYTVKGQLDRSALIKQYQPLVRRLAHYMMAKLPASVEVDDLIQVGLIGLADALSRYEASQGVQFETFATQRIRGAMLDELRGNDWMSRGSRKSQKEIETTMRRLEHRLGRTPIESEIAAEMGLSLADYQRLDRAMAIRRGEYDYLLPTALGEELTLATWLFSSGGKLSLERRFQLIRNRDQATVLRGRWELVCIELGSGQPRRMPPEFCAVYLAAALPAPRSGSEDGNATD